MSATRASRVRLELPSTLRPVTGWLRLDLEAHTVREVFEAAFGKTPVLRHHLTLDGRTIRPHVLCILNDTPLPRDEALSRTLADGDVVTIHQAISGG